MKTKGRLKLYVWENVLTDYSSGIMVALATSPQSARKQILKKCDYVIAEDLEKEPQVVTKPDAFIVWGGG